MPGEIRSLVPLVHVENVPRTIAFYERLGFAVVNTFAPPDESEPIWAYLECGDARLMFGRAEERVVPEQQAVLFYAYFDDVALTMQRLSEAGILTGDITYPFYAPRGEFRISDPDGYVIMVTHT